MLNFSEKRRVFVKLAFVQVYYQILIPFALYRYSIKIIRMCRYLKYRDDLIYLKKLHTRSAFLNARIEFAGQK